MAIYCNTLKHNTQYGIDPYCFTPTIYILHKDVNMLLYTINLGLLGLPHNVMHIKLKPIINSFVFDYKSRFKILIYAQKLGYLEFRI